MTQAALLADRRFAPLFWCQAFAAFNDNFLKTALVVLVLYRGGSGVLVALAGAAFVAPFLLVSGISGSMADRFDKAKLATSLKLAEIAPALLAAAGFLLQSPSLLFTALIAFGILAALFGPVKYGILPELVTEPRLPAANALIEAATFLAILLGTVLGGALGTRLPALLAAITAAFALAAALAAWLIPRPGPAEPSLPLRVSPLLPLRSLQSRPGLPQAALISAWFWLCGVTALTLLPVLLKQTLHRGPGAVTLGLAAFSFGIGAGSFLAARLARGRIALAHAVAGTAALGTAMAALGALTALAGAATPLALALALLFLTAASGGLIAVPSFAAVQAWADPARRARAVAGSNILSAAAMVAATLTLALFFHLHATPPALFATLGIATLLTAWPLHRMVHGLSGDTGLLGRKRFA